MVVEIIPYRSFKEKIKIVKEELEKNRKVEVMDNPKVIYSRKFKEVK